MSSINREETLAWLREYSYFYPTFAPENVDLKNLVDLWASKFACLEDVDDPAHEIWALAREVALEAPPLVPWTAEEEAIRVESAELECRILHARASEEEVARYRHLRRLIDESPSGQDFQARHDEHNRKYP